MLDCRENIENWVRKMGFLETETEKLEAEIERIRREDATIIEEKEEVKR